MADETTSEETTDSGESSRSSQRADAQPQSQAGSGQTSVAPATLRDKDGKVWTLDAAVQRITELAGENGRYHKRAQTAEQERDTLRQERDTALGRLREREVRDLAATEATKARARNPGAVAKLVALQAVTFDEKTGAPTNLDKLIESIRKEFPELFATGSADGAPPRTGVGVDMNQMIRRATGRG